MDISPEWPSISRSGRRANSFAIVCDRIACHKRREIWREDLIRIMQDDPRRVRLTEIYRVFFEIGALSFGGGLVSWIHREVVTKRGWIPDEEFLSGVALSQILPGVNSTNVSIFVGQRLRGAIGATVAVTAMLTGPFLIVLLAAIAYRWLIGVPGFPSLVEGVAAVAIGMLLRFGVEATRVAARGPVAILATAVTFSLVAFLHWPMLLVVALVAPFSIAYCWPRGEKKPADA
jgi:chromate transporter